MPAVKINPSSHCYAFGTIVLWASAYVFTKVLLACFSPFALGALRYLVASAVLLILAVVGRIGLPAKGDVYKFFFSGMMGFTLYMIAFNTASKTLTSTTGSIIIATVPIFTALFSHVLFQERLKVLAWFAVCIEFAGILILTLWKGVFAINSGVVWMLGAALLLSGYNLTQRQYTKKYTALQSVTYSILAGTILLSVFLPQAVIQLQRATTAQILILIYLGIFPSAIAFIWWSKALSVAQKTSDVSNYMFVTPLLAMIMGYMVIMEVPDISTFFGGAVILSGLVLFTFVNRIGIQLLPAAANNAGAKAEPQQFNH